MGIGCHTKHMACISEICYVTAIWKLSDLQRCHCSGNVQSSKVKAKQNKNQDILTHFRIFMTILTGISVDFTSHKVKCLVSKDIIVWSKLNSSIDAMLEELSFFSEIQAKLPGWLTLVIPFGWYPYTHICL